MARKINRVDLGAQNTVFADYESSNVIEGGNIVPDSNKKTRNVPAHEDLVNCFLTFIPHLMFSSELIIPNHLNDESWFKEQEFLQDEKYDGITVTGISFVGKHDENNDTPGIKLIGRKTTGYGDVVSIVSPIIYFDPNHAKSYPLAKMLKEHVNKLKTELELYLFKNKYAPHFFQTKMAV